MNRLACRGVMLLAAFALAACNESTAPGTDGTAIRFSAVAPSANDISAQARAGSLILTGTNGTLQIDEMHVIVDRFELKRVDDDDCARMDSDCKRFRAGPMLLDLPLDGSGVIAVETPVDSGTYRRLKFKIEDLDHDDDYGRRHRRDDGDDDEHRRGHDDWEDRWPLILELRRAIRAEFPDWPDDASILVIGTFTPTNGEPVAFKAYLEAEVDIEKRLVPPVTIDGGEEGGVFSVELDIARFFQSGRGRVLDLSALDFERTGRVIEIEIEVEDNRVKIDYDR